MENASKINPVPADENLENEPTDEQLRELMQRVWESVAKKAQLRRERFLKNLREQIAEVANEK